MIRASLFTLAGVVLLGLGAGVSSAQDDQSANPPAAEVQPPSFDEIPWEMRPYRVLISLTTGDDPGFTPRFRRQIEETLRTRIEGLLGRYWQTELQSNDWLFPASRAQLDRLSSDDLTARYQATDFDKVMLIVIEDRGGLRLSGCEWDRSSGERGPILQRELIDRRRTADVALELLFDLFRPLARIDLSEGETAELRARGGELLAPESLPVMFQTDDLLVPFFRYLNRDQELRSIQPVPWTYLKIDGITRSRMTAVVETAFNAPLAGARRRVELVAIRTRPAYESTQVRLAPRNNPARPLVGVRVRVYEHLPTEEQPDPEMVELMTDRFGRVVIPAYVHSPLRRLIVHSGGAVISNVPFIPGLAANVSMELPDDSPRLQAEGALAIVQGELIDVVSRRTIMLARALSLARKDDWDEVDDLMAQVNNQPSIGNFRSRILAIRVPAVAEAQRNRDRSAEQRIVAMCRQLEELVERYLDRTAVRDVEAEISELRKASKKPAASG